MTFANAKNMVASAYSHSRGATARYADPNSTSHNGVGEQNCRAHNDQRNRQYGPQRCIQQRAMGLAPPVPLCRNREHRRHDRPGGKKDDTPDKGEGRILPGTFGRKKVAHDQDIRVVDQDLAQLGDQHRPGKVQHLTPQLRCDLLGRGDLALATRRANNHAVTKESPIASTAPLTPRPMPTKITLMSRRDHISAW